MFTNEDYERLLVKYTSQGIPAGESIQHFCDRMKVPYNLFNKWYRDTRHRIVKVKVDGMPDSANTEDREESLMDSLVSEVVHPVSAASPERQKQPDTKPQHTQQGCVDLKQNPSVRIMIDLRTTSGLQIRRRGMTYQEFMDFATKFSALC